MKLFYVDSFASRPFTGNPAAVTLLEEEISIERMQSIAAEVNLSETAFLRKYDGSFHIRWFSPTQEVDLCGHATLAAAHCLWESGNVQSEEIVFSSMSGELKALRDAERITLNFPNDPPVELLDQYEQMSELLGFRPLYVGKNSGDFLVEVSDVDSLKRLNLDLAKVAKFDGRGLIVTSKGEREYDFFSRCFFPQLGINEDPVTGSAHCALAPYWSKKLARKELKAYQASKRGGELFLKMLGDRIEIGGSAVTTIVAELVV